MNKAFIVALIACVAAAVGEGLFMGRDGARWVKSLKQPAFSPSVGVWTLIGIAYYGMCFFLLYRLVSGDPTHTLPLMLLLAVMALNTTWNYVYFRRRDLRMAFWYAAGYAVVAVALEVVLIRVDVVLALAFAAYVAYLPFALVLFYRTWKMNG